MAISQLYDYGFHYIRENELGDISINPETFKIQSVQLEGPNKRYDLFDDRWSDLTEISSYFRKEISSEDFIEIISAAEELINEDYKSNLLILYLGAMTHFYNREFSMSFLMDWTLIEKKIKVDYLTVIEEQIDNEEHHNKLKKRKFQTIDDKLEIIKLTGNMNNEDFERFIELKKLRNNIIHKGARVNELDTNKCLEISTHIIKEILNFDKI